MQQPMANIPLARVSLETVQGRDDRTRVSRTDVYPWCCICALMITAADGSRWVGTAWLAGARTLITAGHCVFMHAHGGWVQSIEIIPGCDGDVRPFGSYIVETSDLRTVRGWAEREDFLLDIGGIILPASLMLGTQLGFFGYGDPGQDALEKLNVTVAGYPMDRQPPFTQWRDTWRPTLVTTARLIYEIDTGGGQSGAPVWFVKNGQRSTVGIHTSGAQGANSAVRIAGNVFRAIDGWAREPDITP
jgi:glutamyl endopeptidase